MPGPNDPPDPATPAPAPAPAPAPTQTAPAQTERDQRIDAIDARIDVVDDGPAQGNAGGGGGQWMRIFVPNVAKQGALLHLGKPGAGGVGYRGITLQSEHDVMVSAVETGMFKTGNQLVLQSGSVSNHISQNDYNAIAFGGMNLGAAGGLVLSSIGAASGLSLDPVPDGGENVPLPDAPLQYMQARNNVYNSIRNAQNFTAAFAGTVMGVKGVLGFSWEPSWFGLTKFTQVCGAFSAVTGAVSSWVKYANGADTVSGPAPAAGGGAGAGGAGGGGAGGATLADAYGKWDKVIKPLGGVGGGAGKAAGKWGSGEAGLGGRQDMRDAGLSDADLNARLKTEPVTKEQVDAARAQVLPHEVDQQIPTGAEVDAARGQVTDADVARQSPSRADIARQSVTDDEWRSAGYDYRAAQELKAKKEAAAQAKARETKAAEARARDNALRDQTQQRDKNAATTIDDIDKERAGRAPPDGAQPPGAAGPPAAQGDGFDEVQREADRARRRYEVEQAFRDDAEAERRRAQGEQSLHESRDRSETWKRAGAAFEAGGAAVGAVLAVKGFADAIKSSPKRSIPGVAMVSDDEIFQGSVKGITGVAGGGFTYVVPSVLSGFSVISGGSVGFQSALKSEIFSLQSVTVEGGLGAELVAAGPVQVMSRMRETSVMGREIKIGAQMGDIVTFAGKINSVMNKGWNPAKQRPTMEVTVKAEKNGKIQIQIDTKKRVFIEPSKVTIEFQGNSIVMTENEVKVVAAKKLSMKCEDMEIEATKSFTVKSPKVDIDASSQAKIHTGGSSIKTGSSAIDMDATTINANKEKLS